MDKRRKLILGSLLSLPLICEPIAIIGGTNGTLYVAIIHIVFFFYCMYSEIRYIKYRDIGILLLFYSIFFLNMMIFPESKKFFFETGTLIAYLIYLPICVFSFQKIKEWDDFFILFKPLIYVATVVAFFLIVYVGSSSLKESISYMQFSYFVLPPAMAAYTIFRKEKSSTFLTLFGILLFALIAYSARATILFLFIYIVVSELTLSKHSKTARYSLVLLFFSFVVLIANQNNIITYLRDIPVLENSRFLAKMAHAELFASAGREIIYDQTMVRLNNVGIEFSGLFGERKYLRGAYPHNFFYEIIMQMGWLVGSIILLWFVYLLIKFFLNKDNRIVSYFLFFGLFARYLISGSYLIEGRFWIFMFCMFSVIKSKMYSKAIYHKQV